MPFRNVDGVSEMVESVGTQLYSCILLANSSQRQSRYSEELDRQRESAQPGPKGLRLPYSFKGGTGFE